VIRQHVLSFVEEHSYVFGVRMYDLLPCCWLLMLPTEP